MQIITCPSCGARYKVPPDAGGKKVRCQKCGTVSRVPSDEAPIPMADEPDFAAEVTAAAQRAAAGASSLRVASDPLQDSESLTEAQRLVEVGRQADIRQTGRSFWGDIGWSFLFIAEPGNLVTFGIVWFLFIASEIVLFALCVGVAASLTLRGWLCAFMLNCISETASGEDDLPKLALTSGFLEDVVMPLLKYVATWLVLFLVPVAYLLVAGSLSAGGLRAFAESLDGFGSLLTLEAGVAGPFFVLVGLALFLWPIAVLAVTIGGVPDLFRFDLMLRTVARSFVPYFVTFVLVVISFAGRYGVKALLNIGGLGTMRAFLSANRLAVLFLGLGATAFLEIAAMRIIGLYYRHHKHRFAWAWD